MVASALEYKTPLLHHREFRVKTTREAGNGYRLSWQPSSNLQLQGRFVNQNGRSHILEGNT